MVGQVAAVEALIMWLLSKEPSDRPTSGEALTSLIQAVLKAPHERERIKAVRAAYQQQRCAADKQQWASRVALGVSAAAFMVWLLLELLAVAPPLDSDGATLHMT